MKAFYKVFITILYLSLNTSIASAQHKIVFTVDMSAFKKPINVGIIGDTPPLNWEKALPMDGPNAKGRYSVTVNFAEKWHGEKVFYRYIINDLVWENEVYGMCGNRTCCLNFEKLHLPVDIWNKLSKFDNETLLYRASAGAYYWVCFAIYCAKKEGKTSVSVAKMHYDLHKGQFSDWVNKPQVFMAMDQLDQAQIPYGELIILVNEPNMVKYKMNKPWTEYFSNKAFKNVYANDYSLFYKTFYQLIVEEVGMELKWKETSDEIIIAITKGKENN